MSIARRMAQFLDFPYDALELGSLPVHSPLTASDAAANARLDEYCALATESGPLAEFNLSNINTHNQVSHSHSHNQTQNHTHGHSVTRDVSPMASLSPQSLTTPSSLSETSPGRSRQGSTESMTSSPSCVNSRRVSEMIDARKPMDSQMIARKAKKMKTQTGFIPTGCSADGNTNTAPPSTVYIRNPSPVSSNNSLSAIFPQPTNQGYIADPAALPNPFSLTSGGAAARLVSLQAAQRVKAQAILSRQKQSIQNASQSRNGFSFQEPVPSPDPLPLSNVPAAVSSPLAGLFGPSWSSAPPNTPAPFFIPPESHPRLLFGPMNTKTRVETQLEFPIILCPAPPGLARLQLPRSAVSKPKFFGKPEEPSPLLLHLSTYVVCTSAMENTYYRRCALLKARGATTLPQPTPAERQILETERTRRNREDPFNLDLAQNGGPVRICAGCIQRERKRATRTKKPNTELSKEWDAYEQNRIIVFNSPEYQDWKPLDRDDEELSQLPPSATCVKITMRIACYCRHHNEKKGFQVIFTIKDHTNTVIAQGITPSILTTDDHKTSQASMGTAGIQRSPLQLSNIQPVIDREALLGEVSLNPVSITATSSPPAAFAKLSPSPDLSSQPASSSPSTGAPSPLENPTNSAERSDQLFASSTATAAPSTSDMSIDPVPEVLSKEQPDCKQLNSCSSLQAKTSFSSNDLDQLAQLIDPAPPSVPSPSATDNTNIYTGKKRKLEDANPEPISTTTSFLDFTNTTLPDAAMTTYPSPSSNLRFSPAALFSSPQFSFSLGDPQPGLISPPEFIQQAPLTLSPAPILHSLAPPDPMLDTLIPLAPTQFQMPTMPQPFSNPFNFSQLRTSHPPPTSMGTHMPPYVSQPAIPALLAAPEPHDTAPRVVRPVITHIIPAESGMSGGIDVACIGTGFSSRIAIYIGDERVIFRKDAIATTNIVFVAPPAKVPGTVPVTVVMPGETLEEALYAYEGNDTRVKFTYVQDDDQMLMEQALRILCSQAGRAEDHKSYARTIVESHQRASGGGGGGASGNGAGAAGSYNRYSCGEDQLQDIETLFLACLDKIVDYADKNESRTRVVAAALDLPRSNKSNLLSLASGRGYNRAVSALLQLGVDVDSRDRCGYTPLMIAARRGHSEVVSTLLNFRADPFVRNLNGQTALDLASDEASRGHLRMWSKFSRPSARTHRLLYHRLAGKLQLAYSLVRSPFVDVSDEPAPGSDFDSTRSLASSFDVDRAESQADALLSQDEVDTVSEGGGASMGSMSGLRITRFLEGASHAPIVDEASVTGTAPADPVLEVIGLSGGGSASAGAASGIDDAAGAAASAENDESWIQRLSALANLRNPFMLPNIIQLLPRRLTPAPVEDERENEEGVEATTDTETPSGSGGEAEVSAAPVSQPGKAECPPPYSEACGGKVISAGTKDGRQSCTEQAGMREGPQETGSASLPAEASHSFPPRPESTTVPPPLSSSPSPPPPPPSRMASDLHPLKAASGILPQSTIPLLHTSSAPAGSASAQVMAQTQSQPQTAGLHKAGTTIGAVPTGVTSAASTSAAAGTTSGTTTSGGRRMRSRTVQIIPGSKGCLTAADQQQLRDARNKLTGRSNDWHLYLFWVPLLLLIMYFTVYPRLYLSADWGIADIQHSAHGFVSGVWQQVLSDFRLPQPLRSFQQQQQQHGGGGGGIRVSSTG